MQARQHTSFYRFGLGTGMWAVLVAGAIACGDDGSPQTSAPLASSPAAGQPTPAPAASPPAAGAGAEPSAPTPAPAATPPNDEQPGAGAMLEPSVPSASGAGTSSPPDAGATAAPQTDPEEPSAEEPPQAEPPPFAPCPTDGNPCAVMPLGDSITFGIGSSGGGYRVELFREALSDGHPITFVGTAPPNGPQTVDGQPFPRDHQGHPGFTISGGGAGSLAGLVDASLQATNPNIVLLMIGTNDINGNIDVQNAPARLGALLDQITTDVPDALLVVAQMVPTTNAGTNTRVEAYNAAIPALVQERVDAGKHLALVDMYAPFVADPNFATTLMNDVLHPNDAGYVVMARTWYTAIEPFLPE